MSVVNTNVSASLAQAALAKNERALGTAMEQLSTGSKINSAKDDAAGLAMASKFTAQIKGLDMAVKNASDAISMISTAEGALDEVGTMLQRMRELAVQSSNGTVTAEDRDYMDLEYQALDNEINRIANNTQWNGENVLNGKAGGQGESGADSSTVTFQISANFSEVSAAQASDAVNYAASDLTSATLFTDGTTVDNAPVGTTEAVTAQTAQTAHGAVDHTTVTDVDSVEAALGSGWTIATVDGNAPTDGTGTVGDGEVHVYANGSEQITINFNTTNGSTDLRSGVTAHDGIAAGTYADVDALEAALNASGSDFVISSIGGTTTTDAAADGATALANGTAYVFTSTAGSDTVTLTTATGKTALTDTDTVATWETAISTYNADASNTDIVVPTAISGATDKTVALNSVEKTAAKVAGSNDVIKVDFGNFASGMTAVNSSDLQTQDNAQSAMSKIDTAMTTVNLQRATFGSATNRLEHAVDNMTNIQNNAEASRSRIEDTDYAETTSELAKAQIIAQAGTAMLAQANQSSQSVLSLLR